MMRAFLTTGVLLGSLAATVGATPFTAPPACVTATYDIYLIIGPSGCSVGPVGFSGFGFAVTAAGGGAVPITPAGVLVTPFAAGNLFGLRFSSGGFSVTGSEFVSYLLDYTVDPHPIIFGVEEEMETSSPVAPGLARVTTDLCVGFPFNPGPVCAGTPATLTVFHDGIAPDLFDSVNFAPVAFIGVRNNIDLLARGASADFDSFSNGFRVISQAPEPTTFALLAAGLLGLALWRARAARREKIPGRTRAAGPGLCQDQASGPRFSLTLWQPQKRETARPK